MLSILGTIVFKNFLSMKRYKLCAFRHFNEINKKKTDRYNVSLKNIDCFPEIYSHVGKLFTLNN